MNRVTINIGIMRYISNSKYEVISIMNSVIIFFYWYIFINNIKYVKHIKKGKYHCCLLQSS